MGQLFEDIKRAVREERYVIGQHATEQMRLRRIAPWQIIAGLENGRLLAERPKASPNPVAEVEQLLPDGTEVKAVWAWLAIARNAKLVTVHFFD